MTQPTEPGDQQASEPPAATPQWPSTPGEGAAAAPPPAGSVPPPPTYVAAPQTSNSAIAALVLSITAWFICPIIPAIIALVFASKADREIAVSNGWVTGAGMVTAAKIVSWINIGLYAALAAIGLLVVVLTAITGSLS